MKALEFSSNFVKMLANNNLLVEQGADPDVARKRYVAVVDKDTIEPVAALFELNMQQSAADVEAELNSRLVNAL